MLQRNLNRSAAPVEKVTAILKCRIRSCHFDFTLVLLSLFILIQGCAVFRSSIPKSLEAEDRAYMQLDLDESRAILNCVLEDPNSSIDNKVRAFQSLAVQDWLFYRDRNNAIERLREADSLGIKRCATWQIVSRIERESSHFLEAQKAARNVLLYARGTTDTLNSKILLAQAIHDECVHCLKDSIPVNRNLLQKASELLCSVLEKEPGRPLPSQLLFGVSLFLDDGPTALKAWRSYFHLLPNESIPNPLKEPAGILTTLLPTWKERSLSRQERAQLVQALTQSRFFEYAVLMIGDLKEHEYDHSPESPDVSEIRSYWEFLGQVKKTTEDFYRRTAVGGGKNSFFSTISSFFRDRSYQASLKDIAQSFWRKLSWTREHSEFNETLFAEEMNKRFGLEWWLGTHNRYYGLLAGHRVLDTTRMITQYGFRSKVRFVSLDMMVSDGYSSWFWDGRAMIGGTASESTVYQFRPSYIEEPFGIWEMINDPERRAETERKIMDSKSADDSLARVKPYASLSGLALRLRYAGANRLLTALQLKGLKGPDLCLGFVSEWERLAIESSIFAHEGRHLIDKQLFGTSFNDSLSPIDQEYNAKLSEAIFSLDAKIAFSKLISAYGGDASPHGQAEERIMRVVVSWMNEHKGEIAGFDPTRPSMPQFDLLMDDQIRRLLQLVDPLASRR